MNFVQSAKRVIGIIAGIAATAGCLTFIYIIMMIVERFEE